MDRCAQTKVNVIESLVFCPIEIAGGNCECNPNHTYIEEDQDDIDREPVRDGNGNRKLR